MIDIKGENRGESMGKYVVKLTEDERKNLLSMINKGKGSAKRLSHARILIEADEGIEGIKRKSDEEIAGQIYVSKDTVKRVCKRCVEEGLESALSRKPHSKTKPRKIQGDEEAQLIALCCSNPPEGRSRWTLKLLSDKLVELTLLKSISTPGVGRAQKKMN